MSTTEDTRAPYEAGPCQNEFGPCAKHCGQCAPAPPLVGGGGGEGEELLLSDAVKAMLRYRAGQATPGPWQAFDEVEISTVPDQQWISEKVVSGYDPTPMSLENAAYIALAHPANILALLDENATLRHRLGEAEAAGAAAKQAHQADLDKWGEYEHKLRNELQAKIGAELNELNSHYESNLSALRAKLATEGEQEAQLLKLHEELRGLRAALRVAEPVLAECPSLPPFNEHGESAAAHALSVARAALWRAPSAFAPLSAAAPIQGEEGKEGQGNE